MSPAPLLYMAQSAARGGKREKMKTRGGCSDLKGAKRRGDLMAFNMLNPESGWIYG